MAGTVERARVGTEAVDAREAGQALADAAIEAGARTRAVVGARGARAVAPAEARVARALT